MAYVTSLSDAPKNPHFAIVEFISIYVPGDERSRRCPGHGYPEHTYNQCNYIAYDNEVEWKREIERRMNSTYGDKRFFAIRANPASITTEHKVIIS